MAVYDFKVPFINAEGIATEKTLVDALREFLNNQSGNKEDTLTHIQWLGELKKDGTLDLGEGERKKLLDTILNSNITFVFVKEQYLSILEKKPE